MHELVQSLIERQASIGRPQWDSFFDCLGDGTLKRHDAVAVVASLSTKLPDHASVGAMIDALQARRDHPPVGQAVNIVGTGGGPPTMNISTAAALVAASVGVRVIKTGSRARSSRYGSLDALKLLGVPLAASYDELHERLHECGIAFAGPFVYPPELNLLARSIVPLEMRKVGRFFNYIGPFLASVPVSAQLTGVADQALLPLLQALATNHVRHRVWLCFNDLGVDELVSFEANTICVDGPANRIELTPRRLGPSAGTIADLRPAESPERMVRQLLGALSGDAPAAAIESICLNAAALMVAGGVSSEWPEATRAARDAISRGHARELLRRLRADAGKRVPA
jgi:anthranilate phosphoribosyltransferase